MSSVIQKRQPDDRLRTGFVMPISKNFLQQAKQIVLYNLNDENFGVKELSEALHLSPSQLYRKIKVETDGSPSVFIKCIRLQIAKKLLLETDQTITEITYQVGFADITYFSHCFKEHYGKTATQVRDDAR